MRRARHLSPSAEVSSSSYHCIDRVVNRDRLLGRVEKNMFTELMRKYAAYHDIQILSHCLMDNHFHLLVEVPPKKKGAPIAMSDNHFLARLKAFASPKYYGDIKQKIIGFRKNGKEKDADDLKDRHTCRMKDLSCFMKGLKRRFSQWFNKTHDRTGTLWEGRFRSILVEDGFALRMMSAYIDLNPIRAGMVDRPEDYRWSSYGVAMTPLDNEDRRLARAGLCRVMQLNRETRGRVSPADSEVLWEGDSYKKFEKSKSKFDKKYTPEDAVKSMMTSGGAGWYRMMLFADGVEVFVSKPAIGVEKFHVRNGFKREDVEKVLASGGKLSVGEALRCKIRYFSHGMVFGSFDFVNRVFDGSQGFFSENRKSGARPIRGVDWKGLSNRLYSMRELKNEILK